MRLSKFLSLSVAMSRNQAKFFIRKGRVSVDGRVIADPNFELANTSHTIFDGKPISIVAHQYVLLHKPASYVCKAKDKEYTSVLELLENRSENRYYFANVLGPELTGLVVLSDDARWTNRMQRKFLKKSCNYQATLKKIISEDQLRRINEALLETSENQIGLIIDIQKQDGKTLLLNMKRNDIQYILDIFSSMGLSIETLHLQQLGRLSLGDLKEGGYLELTENEF